jgi:hypothetical protein
LRPVKEFTKGKSGAILNKHITRHTVYPHKFKKKYDSLSKEDK